MSTAIDRCPVGVIGRPVDPEDGGPQKRAQKRAGETGEEGGRGEAESVGVILCKLITR